MKHLLLSNDIHLNIEISICDNPLAVLIINHGFAEHIGRYDYVADYLCQKQFIIIRYDLRGHGDTLGKSGDIENYRQWVSDCNSVVRFAKDEYPDLPVFMLGHSMGGLVSVLYALRYPHALKGQILSGPALYELPQVAGLKSQALMIASSLIPQMTMKNVVDEGLSTDSNVLEDYLSDPKVLKKASFRFFYQFLINAANRVKRDEKTYNYPVLILHGEKDPVVPQEVSNKFYHHIASEDKTRIVYPKLLHEILNEPSRDDILETITRWIKERI